MNDLPDYGLWQLVIINSVIFLIFVFSFFKPQTRRDWRTFGTFAAFIIAFGHISIRWYGLMIALVFLAGTWLAGKEAERKGIGKERIQNFFLYAFLGAIVGARLYFVAFSDVTAFWKKPLSVFAIWEGGLAIHVAILGGLLVSFIFARHHRIDLTKFLDTLAPSLILGQAVGRIGCFFNGDAHGYPTTMPWGLVYSPESIAGQIYPGLPLHLNRLKTL